MADAIRILLRRDSAANWATNNPILADGEPGIESDTNRQKFGDGTHHWNYLPYASGTAEVGDECCENFGLPELIDGDGEFTYNGQDSGGGGGAVTSVNGLGGAVELTTSEIPEGSRLYFTAARVLATVLTGLSTAAGTIVTSSHTILQAIGFLQKQVSDNLTALTAGDAATLASAQTYADALVTGLWDDRGTFSAAGNVFPSSGGSGSAGAVKKGDIWTISVAGTLGGHAVNIGDTVRALVDTPDQTDANWAIGENNIGYVPENAANKSSDVETDKLSTTKYATVKAIYDWAVGKFQTILESGTSIKTINSISVLGSGDIVISGGGSSYDESHPIQDTSSNELLKFSKATTAVNELTIGNAAAGASPTIQATGGDSTVNVNVRVKGAGGALSLEESGFSTYPTTWRPRTSGQTSELLMSAGDYRGTIGIGGVAFGLSVVDPSNTDGYYTKVTAGVGGGKRQVHIGGGTLGVGLGVDANTGDVMIGTTDSPTANSGKVLVFGSNGGTDPTLAAATAALYNKSGEMYSRDASGNSTLISPHEPGTDKWIFLSYNDKTGRRVKVDMEKLIRAVEEITGETIMIETFE